MTRIPKDVALPKPLSLRRNFSWTLAGNVVYAACQWGMLIVLAKLGSSEKVGQFALGFAVAAPLISFSNLQLRTLLATDAEDEFHFKDYLRLRGISTAVAILSICGIALAGHYATGTASIVLVIGVAKACESLSDIFYGLMQKYERLDWVARSLLIKGPLSLCAFGVTLHVTGDLFYATLAMATVWAIILCGHDAPCGFSLAANQRFEHSAEPTIGAHYLGNGGFSRVSVLAKLAWRSLPLGFVAAMTSLNINIPRYLLQSHLGEGALGIFAALAVFMRLGFYVQTALVQSTLPRLSRLFRAGNIDRFLTLLSKLILLSCWMGLVAILASWLFGRPVLGICFGPEYSDHNATFVCIMIAAAIGYVNGFLKASLVAARCLALQVPLIVGAAAITVLAGLILVPQYGILGAGLSIVAARTALFFGWVALLKHALATSESKRQIGA